MVTTRADEGVLALPAPSVAVVVKLWLPLASAPVVYVHAPALFVVAVPSFVELSNTVIVLFTSAVPFSVTVAPLTVSLKNTGAAGAVVSICEPPWVTLLSDRLAAFPGAVLDRGAGGQVECCHHQVGCVLSGQHGVSEGQGARSRTAGVCPRCRRHSKLASVCRRPSRFR